MNPTSSRAYSSTPIQELAIDELRQILLTCDGRGKEVKAEALEELLQRQRIKIENEISGWDGGQSV